MTKKSIILTVTLFALIVVGMFAYAYLKQAELSEPIANEQPVQNEEEGEYADIERVSATHFFIDGTHTLVGEVNMPTPCDLLETNTEVRESSPEQVVVNFTVVNNADTCAQVITPQRFMVEVDVSEDATFEAQFMGRNIELNLIPAPEGETPEDFELFIKG